MWTLAAGAIGSTGVLEGCSAAAKAGARAPTRGGHVVEVGLADIKTLNPVLVSDTR